MTRSFLPFTFIVITMLSCNNESIAPLGDQQLGLVIKAPYNNGTNALILLEDGRVINPVSGFNPQNVTAGKKFMLTFEQISSQGKILDVKVTSVTPRNEFPFTPSNTPDSVAFKSAIQGTHLCTATFASMSDLSFTGMKFNFVVNGNKFQSSSTYAPMEPAGAGTYQFGGDQIKNIRFRNVTDIPPRIAPEFFLNGYFNYAVFDEFIVIWTFYDVLGHGVYAGYFIDR